MSNISNESCHNYVTHNVYVENNGADLPAEFDCYITETTVNDCLCYEASFTYDFTEELTHDMLLALKQGQHFMLWLIEHEEDISYNYEAFIDNDID